MNNQKHYPKAEELACLRRLEKLMAQRTILLEALHIAKMQIANDLYIRIQQPIEKSANEVILKVIENAIDEVEADL